MFEALLAQPSCMRFRPGVVLLDAGYCNNSELRTEIAKSEPIYAAGILPTTWCGRPVPELPTKKWYGRGWPPKLMRSDAMHRPALGQRLALGLRMRAWRTIIWREGTADRLSSRFARLRVRVAHRDCRLSKGQPEEWVLIERPDGEKEQRPNIGFRHSRNIALFLLLLTLLSNVGASRVVIRSSSKKLGSVNTTADYPRFSSVAMCYIATYGFDFRAGQIAPLGAGAAAVIATCATRRISLQRIRLCGLSGSFRIRKGAQTMDRR